MFVNFRGQPLRMPKDCLFPGEMTADSAQMKELKEQAKFAMAVVAMREGKHEEALNGFETLYQPQASYYTGLVGTQLRTHHVAKTSDQCLVNFLTLNQVFSSVFLVRA